MASPSIAPFIAIPSTILLAGYNTACSHVTIPALADLSAALALPTFIHLYMANLKQIFLLLSISSLVSFEYLAYDAYANDRREEAYVYASAAALVFAGGLVTKIVQLPGVERLNEICDTATWETGYEVPVEARRRMLLGARQIWIRVGLAIAAGGLGLFASIGMGGVSTS